MTTPTPFNPGYRLTDGDQLNTNIASPQWSFGANVSALTGGTVNNSPLLTTTMTEITSATALAGLKLPQAIPGYFHIVQNNTANTVVIYADKGSTINGVPGNIGWTLDAGSALMFSAFDVGAWTVMQWSVNANYLQTVDTIATLRTIGINGAETLSVEGYYTRADGGGGLFYAAYGAAPGTYVDNGGTIIVPTGGNGSAAWLRQNTGVATSKEFGAKADGITDDTVALQKLTLWAKPANLVLYSGSRIAVISEGTHIVNAPISVYSGMTLQGLGQGSVIKLGPSFVGAGLIVADNLYPIQYTRGVIENLLLDTNGSATVWAFTSKVGFVLQCFFKLIYLNGGLGLDLSVGYTQSCVLDTIYSAYGTLDQMVVIYGNRNLMTNLDMETAAGVTTNPIVVIKGCSNMMITNTLLEGTNSLNKTGFLITDNFVAGVGTRSSGVSIQNCWFEFQTFTGYAVEIENTSVVYFYQGYAYLFYPNSYIKVSNNSYVYMQRAQFSSNVSSLAQNIDVDATSTFETDYAIGRYTLDLYDCLKLDKNFKIKSASTQGTTIPTGLRSQSAVSNFGNNILVNPSFEAGLYGWTWNSAVGFTITFPASSINDGLMMDVVSATPVTRVLYQTIPISAAQVGVPITVTMKVNVLAGDAGAYAGSYITGAGITSGGGAVARASLGAGWQILTLTAEPQAAGSLLVGVQIFNATQVQFDQATCYFGTLSVPDFSAQKTSVLNGSNIAATTAAPTTGTWNVGDIVWNQTAAVGKNQGWVCTVAGSPGTWTPFGQMGYLPVGYLANNTAPSGGGTLNLVATDIWMGGVASNTLAMTYAILSNSQMVLPTATNLATGIRNTTGTNSINQTFDFYILNTGGVGSGSQWTVVTNTGWTLSGTMTVAAGTWRHFIVTITSATTAELRSTGRIGNLG